MRPFEIVLLLANSLIGAVLLIPRFRAAIWTGYVVIVGLLALGAQVIVEGPRWQTVPAYTLAGILILAWIALQPKSRWARGAAGKRPVNRFMTIAGAGLLLLALAVSLAPPILVPIFRFPRPTGPYAIGTVTYHWVDAGRPEIFTANPSDHRELMVQVWYPARADPAAPPAPWVENADALAPALSRLFRLPPFTFGYIKYVTANAIAAAPVADEAPRYPVVIFLHGFTGFRQMNTFQVEELVSHGYIVAGIDEPYAAAVVSFPDGRQVQGLTRDQMQTLVTQSLTPTEQAPLLNGQELRSGIIPYFAQDVSFTLDQLIRLNRSDPHGILTGRLDLQHAGVFGISLGGIVGPEACRQDARLQACLVMDAPMPADVVRDGLRQPTMWLTRDAATMKLEGWSQADIEQHQTSMRAVYEGLRADGYFIRVPGMFHLNFTDMPSLSPLTSVLGMTGPIDPQRAHNIVNAYTLAFFNQYLKGQPATLLDGPSEQYPHVLFEARRP